MCFQIKSETGLANVSRSKFTRPKSSPLLSPVRWFATRYKGCGGQRWAQASAGRLDLRVSWPDQWFSGQKAKSCCDAYPNRYPWRTRLMKAKTIAVMNEKNAKTHCLRLYSFCFNLSLIALFVVRFYRCLRQVLPNKCSESSLVRHLWSPLLSSLLSIN